MNVKTRIAQIHLTLKIVALFVFDNKMMISLSFTKVINQINVLKKKKIYYDLFEMFDVYTKSHFVYSTLG